MLPIWSLGNGRLIVSMDISMHLPPHNLPLALSLSLPRLLCLFLMSLLLLLPLPRRPACRLPHVRSCMFFFRKTFSLLPFKADTFAHFAHRAAASATATARPHASCLSLPPSCPLARAAGFCPRLGFYPRTHLARKRRARINLLNFAAFATVAAAASVAATASACGMY